MGAENAAKTEDACKADSVSASSLTDDYASGGIVFWRREMNSWHNVSRKEPCPICGKPDWCTVSDDGMMCVCRRIESQHMAKSGMGWIHVLVDRPKREYVPRMPVRPVRPSIDARAIMDGFRREFDAPAAGRDIFDSFIEIAKDLNLRAADIDRLEVGRSAFHRAWAFPMLDGSGACVGIRLRAYGSSKKWSVTGSRDGLFYDPALEPREAVESGLKGRELVVVEGATDCIAGYAIGLPCVGRSSCGTGKDHLRDLCARLKVNRVTIVTDNDSYKRRPSGMPWRPGIEGARRLAEQLGRCYRIVTPPKKDLREWLYAGLTADKFWSVAGLQPWKV